MASPGNSTLVSNSAQLLQSTYQQNPFSNSPACIQSGTSISIPKEAWIDARDHNEATPLINASFLGQESIVRELLRGANVNFQNIEGYTPLLAALSQGFNTVAMILLQHGASVGLYTLEGVSAVHFATVNGNEQLLHELLIRGAFINSQDDEAETALHWAVREGRADMVGFLLQRGAIHSLSNEEGETPLHLAAICGESAIADLLVNHGANLDSKDCARATPFDLAVSTGNHNVAHLIARSRKSQSTSSWNSSMKEGKFAPSSTPFAVVAAEGL